ncbi:MAG TPA: PQQ-binding-like beta-propeller repeat protein [Verrucomicrobiae bacterium]|nr:PQQ-binding-like beta-propeller repeat protein [Verrucomicrobiae bacterium]
MTSRHLHQPHRPPTHFFQSILAVLASAFLSPGPGVVRAEDWPQWRGLNRDGVWNEAGIMEKFPPGGLTISWRAPVGRGWASPVVAAGRVYVTDVRMGGSTATERVLCFDATNGQALWNHQYTAAYPEWAFSPNAGGPRATPIVRDGKLYTLGALGQLFCLDASHGTVIWAKDLAQEYQVKEFTGITASPLIEDDLLILYLCGKPAACVVAFHRNSGKEVWRALDDSFTYSSVITLSDGGQRQLIVWTQEAITSLNPATGKVWWREELRTLGDQAISTPVFSNHRLLVAGLMFKLNPDRPAAEVLWPATKAASKRVLSNTSTALLQGEHVFSAKTSGELVCLDAGTGQLVWETNTVTELKNGSSIHLTPNGGSTLLFTDQGNLIRARLTSKGYEEIARAHLLEATHPFNGRKVVWPPPAYANGHVFARNDQELICASLAAGQP